MTLTMYNEIEPNMLRQNPAYPVSRTSGDILLFDKMFLLGKKCQNQENKRKKQGYSTPRE